MELCIVKNHTSLKNVSHILYSKKTKIGTKISVQPYIVNSVERIWVVENGAVAAAAAAVGVVGGEITNSSSV